MENFHIFLEALKNKFQRRGITYPPELAGILEPVGGCDLSARDIQYR